jgi:hypothetical protein
VSIRWGAVAGAILLAAWVPLATGGALAQAPTGPTPTPDLRPTEPPPEVINCARPFAEKRIPSLDSNEKLNVTLDLATGAVTVEVFNLPNGVTCYAIGREPSGTWPAKQGWSEQEITVVEPFVDLVPKSSAGRYCYRVLFGNSQGHSGQSEPVCIDMPSTIAPTPTATPTMGPTPIPPQSPGLPGPAVPSPTLHSEPSETRVSATPIAPGVGNGQVANAGSSQGNCFAGVAMLVAAMVAFAGLALGRRR